MTKRVAIMSDTHCGCTVGLTPPNWVAKVTKGRWDQQQRELWDLYIDMVQSIKPIDILLFNGDAVQGKNSRWGNRGLITADRIEQADMATAIIEMVGAKKIYMTYGTAYHTGIDEDWEKIVAHQVKAVSISGQEWVDVNGLIFDMKHFVGASSIPHGKGTAIARDRLWNLIYAEHEEQPKSDVLIRSHRHAFDYAGSDNWLGIVTPALQGHGDLFGARIPSTYIHFGIVIFDVESKNEFSWKQLIAKPKTHKAQPHKA